MTREVLNYYSRPALTPTSELSLTDGKSSVCSTSAISLSRITPSHLCYLSSFHLQSSESSVTRLTDGKLLFVRVMSSTSAISLFRMTRYQLQSSVSSTTRLTDGARVMSSTSVRDPICIIYVICRVSKPGWLDDWNCSTESIRASGRESETE